MWPGPSGTLCLLQRGRPVVRERAGDGVLELRGVPPGAEAPVRLELSRVQRLSLLQSQPDRPQYHRRAYEAVMAFWAAMHGVVGSA